MNLLLGSKNDFGVEIKATGKSNHGSLMGYARLWFGGNFFGTINSYIFLDGYLLGGLYQMLRTKYLNDVSFPEDVTEQFLYFKRRSNDLEDDEIDWYRFDCGTMTDDFYNWTYRKDDCLTIIWKIRDQPNKYHEDLLGYPQSVFSYQIKYDDFKELVERLDRLLKNW